MGEAYPKSKVAPPEASSRAGVWWQVVRASDIHPLCPGCSVPMCPLPPPPHPCSCAPSPLAAVPPCGHHLLGPLPPGQGGLSPPPTTASMELVLEASGEWPAAASICPTVDVSLSASWGWSLTLPHPPSLTAFYMAPPPSLPGEDCGGDVEVCTRVWQVVSCVAP